MRKYITKASERIGVESTSRDGKRAQVVSYSTCENFIIRFCDGKEMKLKNWRYFIEGNFNYEKHFKAPRNREERIGEKKVMNNGLTAEVIEYRGSHDMDILFEGGIVRLVLFISSIAFNILLIIRANSPIKDSYISFILTFCLKRTIILFG